MGRPWARAAVGAALVVAPLSACEPSTPGDSPSPAAQPDWPAGGPRDTVTSVVLDAEDALTRMHPDVTFTDADLDASRSTPCFGSPADGDAIAWLSERWLTVEPQQDTMPFVAQLTDYLVARGWTVGQGSTSEDDAVQLYRDDYQLTLVGDAANGKAMVRITATSPCSETEAIGS